MVDLSPRSDACRLLARGLRFLEPLRGIVRLDSARGRVTMSCGRVRWGELAARRAYRYAIYVGFLSQVSSRQVEID